MKRFVFGLFVLAAIVSGLFLTGKAAWAASLVFDNFDSCTTANCNASIYNGSYLVSSESDANPFILQVFASRNECLRLDVIAQDQDMEMVIVSPDGAVWRNDDTGGLMPEIRVITRDISGWYTLQVSNFAGDGDPVGDFTLAYGRYNTSNPNCAGATVPFSASSSSGKHKEAN